MTEDLTNQGTAAGGAESGAESPQTGRTPLSAAERAVASGPGSPSADQASRQSTTEGTRTQEAGRAPDLGPNPTEADELHVAAARHAALDRQPAAHGGTPQHAQVLEGRSCELPVAEKFVSINGEGTHAGRLAAFIRLTGCNLSCSWCDTTWANQPDCPRTPTSTHALATWVEQTGAQCVTITGGEPLLHKGVRGLLEDLAEVCERSGRRPALYVEVETNGSVDLAGWTRWRSTVARGGGQLSFTVDCKLPSSGMHDHMLPDNVALLESQDTVKFVCGTDQDLERALELIRKHDLERRCNVYLSPVFGQLEPARLVDFMRQNNLARTTLQLQLQKIIWPDVQKGV